MAKVRVVFFFLNNLDFFSMIFRIRIVVETSISGFSEPVVACLQLIIEVFIIVFLRRFIDEFIGISTLCSEREVSSSVSVCWSYVLIVSFIAWELR